MTNYKYAELFAANVHERHQRIALELVTDLDPDDDNAIIMADIIRRTNERASLHDRIIRANPENRRRRLALLVQGRGGGRSGGRMGGRGGRNTERFDPQRHKICRLLKSLYGLKQAGRNWYLDLKDYLVELGFKPGEVDIGMYSAAVGTENEIWILVYVDDIIFASKNEQTKDIFAGHLRKKYRITEPAQLTWALDTCRIRFV